MSTMGMNLKVLEKAHTSEVIELFQKMVKIIDDWEEKREALMVDAKRQYDGYHHFQSKMDQEAEIEANKEGEKEGKAEKEEEKESETEENEPEAEEKEEGKMEEAEEEDETEPDSEIEETEEEETKGNEVKGAEKNVEEGADETEGDEEEEEANEEDAAALGEEEDEKTEGEVEANQRQRREREKEKGGVECVLQKKLGQLIDLMDQAQKKCGAGEKEVGFILPIEITSAVILSQAPKLTVIQSKQVLKITMGLQKGKSHGPESVDQAKGIQHMWGFLLKLLLSSN